MVPVGIVGLGPSWDVRYWPALKSLRKRIAVRAVYDPVLSRAEIAAAELGAVPVSGMRALARRDDLKALLVFDTGWSGTAAIEVLCGAGRPIFIGESFTADPESLDRLVEAAMGCGTMVMPALGARYTPATSRLRELMATRLGRPLSIEIDAVPPDCHDEAAAAHFPRREGFEEFAARVVDWCCYVVPTPPSHVEAIANGNGVPSAIHFRFAVPRAGGERPEVVIQLRSPGNGEAVASPAARYHVRCERGEATLVAVDRIVWRTDSEQAEESLVADRSAVQVMLDHFCRRVVGGLIPVAGLDDLRRSRRLIRAALHSHQTGVPVRLNGQA